MMNKYSSNNDTRNYFADFREGVRQANQEVDLVGD